MVENISNMLKKELLIIFLFFKRKVTVKPKPCFFFLAINRLAKPDLLHVDVQENITNIIYIIYNIIPI